MKKILFIFAFVAFFLGTVSSKEYKIPLIGAKAPSFTLESTSGKLTFPKDFGKNWKILFSHPRDFTPVCSSEILELAYAQKEFEKLGVKIAIISTDIISQHHMWKAHLEELDYKNRGPQKINFPLFADEQGRVSVAYGMIHEPASTTRDVRGVFIVDPDNVVRAINFYPMEIGRNVDEIKRMVVALQTTDEETVLTPANWHAGEDVLIPHFPYTQEKLEENPEIKKQYYQVGNRMWFKKAVN